MQQAAFLRSLGMLLEKGYSVSQALDLLKFQFERQKNYPIKDIQCELKKGLPLVEVLADHRIPSDVLGYLYFASEYGSLSKGLKEGSTILQKREDVKKVFYQKIRYPIVLLSVLAIMMFFMVQYLFPQFTSLFHSVNLELPIVTRVMIGIFEHIPAFIYGSLALSILLFSYGHFKYYKLTTFEKLLRLSKVPFISIPLKVFLTHYFTFQLGHLLKGGLSIPQALQLFQQQSHMPFFQEEAGQLICELRTGESFSKIIQERVFYLPELSQVIHFGQSNGQLGQELILYSDMLLERTDEQIQKSLTFIQPILFSLIGGVILTLFLSVMLPIFRMFQSL